ncbi:helix-turn-helix transcriptional regulator [candidate division KSB1 bacterium]|nr:helix-turn-helix transcriptional regulator [candidate division KSB1 bacterium]
MATLRDAAGLTQAELARKIIVSPARISRIESGDVTLTEDEREQLLEAIGTDDAKALRDYLNQKWDELEPAPFDHPNREVLWLANGLLGKLRNLKADSELKSVFVRHIEIYESELRSLAANLRLTDHNVAFVGSIGVGKTTAICMLTNLRISDEGPLNKQVVLEAGAGGTTICEVQIKTGPQFGLIVEPRSDEEIKYDVADFAEYLLRATKASPASNDGDIEGGPSVTKEINRAIRNMSGLAETKIKDPATGRPIRRDPARELALKYTDAKELVIQILLHMNLPRRDQRDIWYPEGSNLSGLAWLQQTFTEINNGRNPQFSLPKRIEVIIPMAIFDAEELNIRIIDTKGIDGAATRADLDRLFDDSRTLIVLCSRFNDAPESTLQQLLQRVKEAGARNIVNKTTILVLPRPEEAAAVKDNSGNLVDDEQEGYELKRSDVEMHLTRLGFRAVSVEFFNAQNKDSLPLRDFIVSRVRDIRRSWDQRVQVLSKTVDDLIINHKKEQTAVVFQEVMRRLNTWLSKNRDIEEIAEQAQQELIKVIRLTHWRSVWASVRRKGEWYNLDYYHEIGFGARTIAAKYILKKTNEFEVIIQNLLDDEDLSPAHDMLEQVKQMLHSKSDEILKMMEIVGKTTFEDDLKADKEFWNNLESKSGTGYRDSVAITSDHWFKMTERAERHGFVKEKIVEGWKEILASLDGLVDQVVNA